jgi:hypothetical protein
MESAIKLARQVSTRFEISVMAFDDLLSSVLVRAESTTTQASHFQTRVLPWQYGHRTIFVWTFLTARALRGDSPT